MGTFYHKKDQFKRELNKKIDLMHKHKQAISVAIYSHSAKGNKQPKHDKEIGELGMCYHLDFHKMHKIIIKPLMKFKKVKLLQEVK